jgi:hypothetical protein
LTLVEAGVAQMLHVLTASGAQHRKVEIDKVGDEVVLKNIQTPARGPEAKSTICGKTPKSRQPKDLGRWFIEYLEVYNL